MEIRQALTFDDVMLVPSASSILPGGTDTRTRLTREIELGIHQISEILPVKGVKLAGELPRELQKYTVYVAAPVTESRMALAFIDHLTGPEARKRLAQAGYTAPE